MPRCADALSICSCFTKAGAKLQKISHICKINFDFLVTFHVNCSFLVIMFLIYNHVCDDNRSHDNAYWALCQQGQVLRSRYRSHSDGASYDLRDVNRCGLCRRGRSSVPHTPSLQSQTSSVHRQASCYRLSG